MIIRIAFPMANESNLHEMLYENDLGLGMKEQMFQHRDLTEISNYYDITAYNNSFNAADSSILSICHFNLRSLKANMDKMISMIHALKISPDIIAVSEQWLNDSNKDSFNHKWI